MPGRRLLQAVVDAAKTVEANGIWLSVWENAGWAISFYEKNGFRKIGTGDFVLGEMIHLDWIMWRPG